MSEIKISLLSDKINDLLEKKLDKKIVEKIRNYIISYKSINDLYKIDPYFLSENQDLEKNKLIKILINAVKIGLFNLNFDVYCTDCNMIVKEYSFLNEIKNETHCPQCSLDVQVDLKKNCFASFTVNENIIKINNEKAFAELNKTLFESKKDKLKKQRFSAIDLISLNDFYILFPEYNINSEQFFPIEDLTFFVSDISNFNELLKKINERDAVFKIRKYIKIGTDIIGSNNGRIIKTIGQTILAIFSEKNNALKSGFEFINEIKKNMTQNIPNINVSIISGNCFCYKVNDCIDFFGSIVNTALIMKEITSIPSIIISQKIKEDQDCLNEISKYTNSIKHAKTKLDNDILDLYIIDVK